FCRTLALGENRCGIDVAGIVVAPEDDAAARTASCARRLRARGRLCGGRLTEKRGRGSCGQRGETAFQHNAGGDSELSTPARVDVPAAQNIFMIVAARTHGSLQSHPLEISATRRSASLEPGDVSPVIRRLRADRALHLIPVRRAVAVLREEPCTHPVCAFAVPEAL